MTIGERIKIARTNAGMTQADLARIMGCTVPDNRPLGEKCKQS